MSVIFVFDGITVNHARELLTDEDPVVEDIGNRCSSSYLTSLADFGVALISGAKLATTGTGPGEWLRNVFDSKFEPIETKTSIKPADLLLEYSDFWNELDSYVRLLTTLSSAQFRFWQEHMIRECREFLGDDSSLREDLADRTQYNFKKEFTYHPALQSKVPERYISKMYDAIFASTGTPAYIEHVHPKAIREFITRNVIAHIVVFCWYRHVTTKGFLLSHCLRWPHCTRATLIEAGSAKALTQRGRKGIPEPRSLWMIREILMPNILTPILRKAAGQERPGTIVQYELQELVASTHFALARQYIEEIVGLLAKGKDQAARDRIVKFVSEFHKDAKPARFAVGFPVSFKTEWEESTEGLGHFLRQEGTTWRDYEEAARQAFPRLFAD